MRRALWRRPSARSMNVGANAAPLAFGRQTPPMPSRKSSPRRMPRQERARDIVRALLTATIQVLEREGLEGASVERISRVAGVSPGSLYQYFSRKEALFVAAYEAHCAQVQERVVQLLSAHASASPAQAARAIITELVALNQRAPQLHRALRWLGAQYAEQPPVRAAHARLRQAVGDFLARSLPPADAERVGFLAMHLVEAAVHAIVLDAPTHMNSEALVREAELALRSYLEATRAGTEARVSRPGRGPAAYSRTPAMRAIS